MVENLDILVRSLNSTLSILCLFQKYITGVFHSRFYHFTWNTLNVLTPVILQLEAVYKSKYTFSPYLASLFPRVFIWNPSGVALLKIYVHFLGNHLRNWQTSQIIFTKLQDSVRGIVLCYWARSARKYLPKSSRFKTCPLKSRKSV